MMRLALRSIGCGIASACLVEGVFREIALAVAFMLMTHNEDDL